MRNIKQTAEVIDFIDRWVMSHLDDIHTAESRRTLQFLAENQSPGRLGDKTLKVQLDV